LVIDLQSFSLSTVIVLTPVDMWITCSLVMPVAELHR
jgi:hypothetical protein